MATMLETELREEEKLKDLIESSVDQSVERAFKRYGGATRTRFSVTKLIVALLAVALLVAGVYWLVRRDANQAVAPVEDHDLTLENKDIFGFKVADFQEPILGESSRQRLLIVQQQEAFVNTTITETGLFQWGVFNKQQVLTIHGTGLYTIDLIEIKRGDVSLNEDTYELTIRIPHAVLYDTVFDPSKTEIGDAKNGWLAFGSIKLTAEQQKTFEVTAREKLGEKLSEEERLAQADRFAILSAYETYQPVVKAVSPAYKVVVEFK